MRMLRHRLFAGKSKQQPMRGSVQPRAELRLMHHTPKQVVSAIVQSAHASRHICATTQLRISSRKEKSGLGVATFARFNYHFEMIVTVYVVCEPPLPIYI